MRSFVSELRRLRDCLRTRAGRTPSMAQARQMTQGNIYGLLVTQTTILAYLDVIAVLSIGSLCMIPLVFFMKKRKRGAGGMRLH